MHAHTHTMLYLLIIAQQQVDWHVLIGCFKVRLARQLHPLSLKYKGLSACVCAPKHSFWTHLMVSLNKGTFFNLAASFWPKNNFHLFSSSRLHQVFYYCVFLSRWFRADLEWRDRHFFNCVWLPFILDCSKPRLFLGVEKPPVLTSKVTQVAFQCLCQCLVFCRQCSDFSR